MTKERRGRNDAAGPLLISVLAHVALLVPLSIPGCSISQPSEDELEKPKQRNEDVLTLTVDILEVVPSSPGKPPRLADEICDPNARPEYYQFDVKPGLAIDRIYQTALGHFSEIYVSPESLEGKRSQTLRGWFRPIDAVRLLAGDAGVCVTDWEDGIDGNGIAVHDCRGSSAPFGRSNETWVRQVWKPPDCSDPKPTPMPDANAA